jgi:DNA invertase Pin-like site-specific DNA recombinase
MKTVALYLRVSTVDQHPETQLLHDLRAMAQQRGFQIVGEYTDRISGTKARRPGLDDLLRDGRRGRFQVVLVWASDRIARSVRHFLEVLDEFNRLSIEFVSFRESIDTGGPLGRAVVIIIGAIAELERNLIIERVRAGMRRARLEGRHIGRRPIEIDRVAVLRDRNRGDSLTDIAKTTGSPALRSAVCSNRRKMPNPYLYRGCSKGVPQGALQLLESKHSKSAVLAPHKVCLLDSTPASPKVAHL